MLDFATTTPGLQNLLYNTDLMPEQVWNNPRRWDLMLEIIEAVRGMLHAHATAALTTERERCALIAEAEIGPECSDCVEPDGTRRFCEQHACHTLRDIAATIRGQNADTQAAG